MTLSDFRHITDELLSAYIDGEVTEQERAFVEAAVAQDEQIAWRLNSLRQTVVLLRELPEMAMPRSFALTLEHIAPVPVAEVLATGESERKTMAAPRRLAPKVAEREMGFWDQLVEGWRDFWQGGNPVLRNAAAVSFALMLMLTSGGLFLTRATQTIGTLATAPEAAPAAASESVALAPTSDAGDSANQTAAAGAPAEQSDSVPQEEAQIAAASDEPSAENARTLKEPDAETESTGESGETSIAAAPAAESALAQESAAEENATQEGVTEEGVTEEGAEPEVAAAAAMSAPEQPAPEPSPTQEAMPPLVAMPVPAGPGGPGIGAGGMGGGADAPPGAGGGGGDSLVPEAAHAFDVDPLGAPEQPPVEDSARIAAAPAEESTESETPAASSAAVAAMDATPAVDAVESATEATETEATETEASEPETAEPETTESEATMAAAAEPTPTPEAVALAAPEVITSSEVVEVVGTEGVASMTGFGIGPDVLWIAQGGALLLTVVLGSLWWRSRTPRRPNE